MVDYRLVKKIPDGAGREKSTSVDVLTEQNEVSKGAQQSALGFSISTQLSCYRDSNEGFLPVDEVLNRLRTPLEADDVDF
jgi:hypothetical protein